MSQSSQSHAAVTLERIQAAEQRIRGEIPATPFRHSITLSEMTGCELFIKFENLHYTSSFKDRGALNKLLLLRRQGCATGVIAVSAGNHAKAVARFAARLGMPATIVMPIHTPNVKVQDTRNVGAKVVLDGINIDEAAVRARQLEREENLSFVHPFDDPDIVAGQGTAALEMLAKVDDLDIIVAPIGGGGLISGLATAARALRPAIRIFGVEVESYPSARGALTGSGHCAGGATLADGIAVKQPGKLNLEIIKKEVEDILIVSEEALEEAIGLYLGVEKTVAEGAGAATLAAVLGNRALFAGHRVAVILSGGNIDSRILASVLMRRLVRQDRIVQLIVEIDDSPGSLAEVAGAMCQYGGNILDVSHQRLFANVPAKRAELHMTVETRDASQVHDILNRLGELGYKARTLAAPPGASVIGLPSPHTAPATAPPKRSA